MEADLSIILPCYRSADLALQSVAELTSYLAATHTGKWEVIVVDDGGRDFPPEPWPSEGPVCLIRLPDNRGKGAAVRAGLAAATGRVRVFTDVDLPYGVELIPVIAALLVERHFHVVIGDRTLPGSTYHQELGWPRRLASHVSAFFIGRLVTGGFFDTQCGLKGVRGDVADLLLPLLRLDGFAFDVELIYAALKHRLDIKRIPVQLIRNETSTVRLGRDLVMSALDILRIKANQIRGLYESPGVSRLLAKEFAAVRATIAVSGSVPERQ